MCIYISWRLDYGSHLSQRSVFTIPPGVSRRPFLGSHRVSTGHHLWRLKSGPSEALGTGPCLKFFWMTSHSKKLLFMKRRNVYMIVWLVVSAPLKNIKINWDDYSQYMESHKSHVPNHQPVVYGTRNHSADLNTSRDAVAEDQASYLRLHWDPPGMRVPQKNLPKIHWVHRWKLPFRGNFIIHLVYLSLSDDQYCVYLCIRILRN